jgi:hypothetical protein
MTKTGWWPLSACFGMPMRLARARNRIVVGRISTRTWLDPHRALPAGVHHADRFDTARRVV